MSATGTVHRRRAVRAIDARVPAAVTVAIVMGLAVLVPRPSAAQESIEDVVSFLLVNRSIPTDDFVQDAQVAAATRDAISRAIVSGLATVPVSASASGFTYRVDRALGGAVVRSSDSFGAFFTERSLTVGERRGSIGLSYQRMAFDALDGRDLRDGTLVGTASTLGTEPTPFDVETISLRIGTETVTLSGSFGLTDRLDVGFALPFVRLTLRGERVDTYRGRDLLQASASSSASGVGDVVMRVKYNVRRGLGTGIAVAADLELPTGSEKNLLGAGRAAVTPRVVWSHEQDRLALDANLGYSFGGVSDEVTYGGAVTVVAAPRLMVVGELAGKRLRSVGRLVETSAPHPRLAGIDTIRLSAVEGSSERIAAAGGIKWNPTGTWLVGMNVLRRLTTAGLTSSWVPSLTIEYAFGE